MTSEKAPLEPLTALTLREHIEQRILDIILNGTFKLGERLVESAIAEQLGVSRAPVREALSALEREGIVVNISRRGYFIINFTDKDIEEIYSLRLILEVAALQRAIDRLTAQDVTELQQIVDDMGAVIGQDLRTTVALDLSFHERICHKADHSRLYSAWNSMRLQTYLLIGVTSATHYDQPEQPRELHQRILNAIAEKDLTQAEIYLNEHIMDAQRRARAALETLHAKDVAETDETNET